jgi:universal stress protein E
VKNLRNILVAIKNPAARSQPALRKAGQLAAATGARLELFHAIADPVYMDAFALEGKGLEQVQKEWRQRDVQRLERHAEKLRRDGLKVDVRCEWDFPAYEAVIRRAARSGADLIVAERHAKKHVLPWLLRFNDWELLRRSPVPVLLIKRAQAWHRPAVIAAIDPSHSFAKPARLDTQILAAASALVDALGGKMHVAHAWPGALMPVERLSQVSADVAQGMERRATRDARAAFVAAVDAAGTVGARRHFLVGHAVDVIPRLARQQHAGIVVMGAISRSGLKRLVVGNIAEQVLDSLACDVLVIKPQDFIARVKSTTRGVQLIPTPPNL